MKYEHCRECICMICSKYPCDCEECKGDVTTACNYFKRKEGKRDGKNIEICQRG